MKARHKVLADKDPVVVACRPWHQGHLLSRAFIGFDNQGDASSACSKLKSKGVKCFISKASS